MLCHCSLSPYCCFFTALLTTTTTTLAMSLLQAHPREQTVAGEGGSSEGKGGGRGGGKGSLNRANSVTSGSTGISGFEAGPPSSNVYDEVQRRFVLLGHPVGLSAHVYI
jgi:hypothetical protein